ncbi:MAG: DNA/RNA nuclease SfsA [Rhodospirillales bacterium]|jgi:sugar fermentation stimulation protein A|nr:DNA/RNA nuclease SfsA [Rhodospirillales bacterium]HIJ42738.1 DNA/RNA nuclease SfsA [Rhodospirillaceae bacterium]MDP7096937.1 DNA/RNA nuclease SfsA [Rhodospirillales bacterium]MDP7214547.1 DNA/RNA nuclease SfsA [Rhodospirillales bacterium]HIJ45710.1 DNA/RNA nuclease SfsA [Rhodospirillaceae bacterium]
MKFPAPLIPGTLIKRYKRFLADVELSGGEIVTAHCPNTGSMLSVSAPGSAVWLSPARTPGRKLAYTWELIQVGDTLVGINTSMSNALVEEAIGNGTIAELAAYPVIRREVRYGKNSRIDLLLESEGLPTCFIEVKNVTMKRNPKASSAVEFPDAVTTRGAKHLAELTDMVSQGARAMMVYLVQRRDGGQFSIAADIDPAYAMALGAAMAAGVEVLCYRCRVAAERIDVTAPLGMEL